MKFLKLILRRLICWAFDWKYKNGQVFTNGMRFERIKNQDAFEIVPYNRGRSNNG